MRVIAALLLSLTMTLWPPPPARADVRIKDIANIRHHVATATTLDGLCDLGHVLYMF